MPFIDDIITVLEGDGVGTYAVDLFATRRAALPMLFSGVINVVETGGTSPEFIQNNVLTPAYIRPTAQITTHARSAKQARRLADLAYYSLTKVRNQFVNSGWYSWIRPLNQPQDLSPDNRGQAQFGFNIQARYNRRDTL